MIISMLCVTCLSVVGEAATEGCGGRGMTIGSRSVFCHLISSIPCLVWFIPPISPTWSNVCLLCFGVQRPIPLSEIKVLQPKFDLATSNFPPLPGCVVSTQGEPVLETRMSDVVRGLKVTSDKVRKTPISCFPPDHLM